jgi:hypothetical protein
MKEKELSEYVPPRAMRMAAMSIGAGAACNPGGDAEPGGGGAACTDTGSNADTTCTHAGNTAGVNCETNGGSAVNQCNEGGSFTK